MRNDLAEPIWCVIRKMYTTNYVGVVMLPRHNKITTALLAGIWLLLGASATALAKETQPNILVIMADDVGWASLSSYHQGVMSI